MSDREGPCLTDENGALDQLYLTCHGCKWLRVHDFHYFYCRDLGDKSQPDYSSVYTGGMKRLSGYPKVDAECRFAAAAESANENSAVASY
jgi:hypothetical protein